MARPIPDLLARREIKYGEKSTDADRIRLGDELREADQLTEALEVYLLAHHETGVDKLRKHARRAGRPSMLLTLRRAHAEITREEWVECGAAAERAGRWREAYRAYTEAGDEARLETVQANLPGYEIYIPAGK